MGLGEAVHVHASMKVLSLLLRNGFGEFGRIDRTGASMKVLSLLLRNIIIGIPFILII